MDKEIVAGGKEAALKAVAEILASKNISYRIGQGLFIAEEHKPDLERAIKEAGVENDVTVLL